MNYYNSKEFKLREEKSIDLGFNPLILLNNTTDGFGVDMTLPPSIAFNFKKNNENIGR